MPRKPRTHRVTALSAGIASGIASRVPARVRRWRPPIPGRPGAPELPRVPPGALVAALLTAAFITLGALASDASDAAPEEAAAATRGGVARTAHGLTAARQNGLPPRSGSGARVVYSVARRQVWLVGPDERVRRRYQVTPGGTPPPGGTHTVFARRALGVGGDGRRVEHAVFFAQLGDTNVGFSAPVEPLPAGRLAERAKLGAAIRESRADGQALWLFATIGRTVEVIG
ncbi:hypothetical protein V2S66_07475 [Streptomyces sp. V4-01]|uniref:L,D-transpeptidase n=1 Tax=Actinacidiphila polyblastidii TaxID=3110430 RepID=A0ABU7P7N6_9ACTN|nr:hypothetical protein [Streptomyces sp. V4-01]